MTTTTTKNIGGSNKSADQSEAPYTTPAGAKPPEATQPQASQTAFRDANNSGRINAGDTGATGAAQNTSGSTGATGSYAETVKSNDDAAKERYEREEKEKLAAEKPYPDAEHLDDADAEKASRKPKGGKDGKHTVTIKGKGTMPIVVDGSMRRVKRGEPIEVSKAELEHIEANGGIALA